MEAYEGGDYDYHLDLDTWSGELRSFLVTPYPVANTGRDFYKFLQMIHGGLLFRPRSSQILRHALNFMARALVHRSKICYMEWRPYPDHELAEERLGREWDHLVRNLDDLCGDSPTLADPRGGRADLP